MTTTVEAHFVSYNSGDYLIDAIGSLTRSPAADADYELCVAVLDNASQDGTVAAVQASFPDVRLIEQPTNTWYGPASNQLVATSSAEFVLIINPDTVVSSELVGALLDAFWADPQIVAAVPRIVDSSGGRQPVWQRMPTLQYEWARLLKGTKLARAVSAVWDADRVTEAYEFPDVPLGAPLPVGFLWSTCILMRADTARAYGPFAASFPMYDTDLEFSHRLATAGATAVYVGDACVTHVGGTSSSSAAKAAMMRQARYRYYRNHHGRVAAESFRIAHATVSGTKRLLGRLRGTRA